MTKVIPFAPMPLPLLKRITSPLMRFSTGTEKMFPGLKRSLEQAEIGLNIREYGAIMIFLVGFYTIFFGALTTLLLSKVTENYWSLGLIVALVMGLMMFFQIIMYPGLAVRKKTRSIEKNLVFALRAILVQLKSGVSLFDSMAVVARGEYGTVSYEFQKAIDAINTGTPEQIALQEMSERNPSPYLRKALWQIVNGMNAGADISNILGETVHSMIREQKIAINKYGAQLRILSLMYMMIGVIMPSLGVTLLIVLFTFPMVGDAIASMPVLNDVGGLLQTYMPGEVYFEGDHIGGISGVRKYKDTNIRMKVESIDGKKGVFALVDDEDKVLRTETVFGTGIDLREYFRENENKTFGESITIKYIGKNFFGQDYVEITRLEPVHLVFWGFLGMVFVMQFMYIGMIKSRRPSIIG